MSTTTARLAADATPPAPRTGHHVMRAPADHPDTPSTARLAPRSLASLLACALCLSTTLVAQQTQIARDASLALVDAFAPDGLRRQAMRVAPQVLPHAVIADARSHDGRITSFVRRVPTGVLGPLDALARHDASESHDATYAGTPMPGLQNPSFTNELVGWDVFVSGGGSSPGDVSVEAGRAVLREGDAFLVELSQAFVLPDGALTLSLDVFADPGFDLADGFIPDAFEISLLDASTLAPVVAPWAAFASSAFNQQEDGSVNLGPSTSFDGQRVTFDVAGVPGGSELLLACDLIGADADVGGGVSVDDALFAFGCGAQGSSANYGEGWPGSGGLVPMLTLLGTPSPCGEITLLMDNPAGGDVPALLAMGFAPDAMPTPFGGTLLVESPIWLDFVLDAGGRIVPTTIPCDASLCGAELDLQVIALDPGASAGWAFSAGLQIVIGDA